MQAPPPLLAAIQPSSCGAARVPQPSPAVRLEVAWAASEQDVRAAQRLRYRVFAGEMLARLSPPPGTQPGLDADGFDPYCDHLLVRAVQPGDAPGQAEVVGTYRVLPPARARAAGGFYTDTEFDLAPLSALRPRALELGRSCVHPHWRLGGVVLGMWSALAAYMLEQDLDTMIGCASMSVADGGAAARTLWRHLRRSHLADPPWRVRPHTPLPIPAEGPATAGLLERAERPFLHLAALDDPTRVSASVPPFSSTPARPFGLDCGGSCFIALSRLARMAVASVTVPASFMAITVACTVV
jgi:putative hemolysin